MRAAPRRTAAAVAGSGHGAARPAASAAAELRGDLRFDRVELLGARRRLGLQPRAAETERVALRATRPARPAGRYLAGSLREWPTKRYVRASISVGPSPARPRAAARAAAARTSHTCIPSTASAGTPSDSARLRIAAAHALDARVLHVHVVLADEDRRQPQDIGEVEASRRSRPGSSRRRRSTRPRRRRCGASRARRRRRRRSRRRRSRSCP